MSTLVNAQPVTIRAWLTEREFFDTLSAATAVPGAVAINLAFMQGWKARGYRGDIAAATGTMLPSVVILLFIARFATPYFDHPLVASFLKGAGIAVAAQIAFASYTFARNLRVHWQNIFACGLGLGLLIIGLHPVFAVLAGASVGYLLMHERMTRPDDNIARDI